MLLEHIANHVYLHFFGHLDDKHFQATKFQEILDWLKEGNPENMTLAELRAEWAEYDAAEITRQCKQGERLPYPQEKEI